MSKDSIINNLFRVASNMLTQFSIEEPLISEDTKLVLNDSAARKELHKILDNPKTGKFNVNVNGKDITFFVEA